jgi:hypothetical protein
MSSGDYLYRNEELYMTPKLKSTVECVLISVDELKQLKLQVEGYKNGQEIICKELEIKVDELKQVKEQLQQAKEMLEKCNPYITKFISNDGISIFVECEFCGVDGYNCIDTHKPGCEYIKMIGGVE